MADEVKVIVLRTAGTNCDEETAFAFESFGAAAELVHINQLFNGTRTLRDYHILAIPGGFTYGDDIEAGRILANELRLRLGEQIQQFVEDGKLIIGICNGFQVLVKTGFLPGHNRDEEYRQNVTLMSNDSGKFEDRWVHLQTGGQSVWTEGLPEKIYLPVAHAEGKFVPKDDRIRRQLRDNRQVAFRYVSSSEDEEPKYPENPNGSVDDIAGISDGTGHILGLMPHPERHFLYTHHPQWTRKKKLTKYGDGAKIFENGVNYIKKNFLMDQRVHS